MSRANVGFIGLGDRGTPMAEALIGARSPFLGAPPRHDHPYACVRRTSRTAEQLRKSIFRGSAASVLRLESL
jgi:3-hydroxyisobutyrate dehydrogenase-like beta-hydroxyacid dehydrogenase